MACCPIKVQRLKVRSLSVDYNEISWEVDDTHLDLLDFTFQVLRSESPMGPFDELTPPMSDQFIFVDNKLENLDRHRVFHYIVRTKAKSGEESWDTDAASLVHEADLVSAEIRSHMNLLMHEFIGERCWVLPARTFGQRCSCYNTTLKKQTRSGCRTCWDTTFVRGFLNPIESWISIDPNTKSEELTALGKTEQKNTTARLTYFPPLKPRDIIIESGEVKRWKVVSVGFTTHAGTPVHQEIQMHQIPQSSIEYQVPLNLCDELKNIYLKPARNFTNPQQLDAVDDDASFAGIMGVFGPQCGRTRPC